MFHSATAFNQDLSSWSVENAADMTLMFVNAKSMNFQNEIKKTWGVSATTAMFIGTCSADPNCGTCGAKKTTTNDFVKCSSHLKPDKPSTDVCTFCADDSEECCTLIPCPAGEYKLDSICTSMTTATCPIGVGFASASAKDAATFEGSTQNDGVCTPCVPGTHKSSTSPSSCTVCAPGTYENSTGSALCKLCPAGKKLVTAETSEYHDALSDCEDCGILKYNPFEGHADECYLCLSAKTMGAADCEGCDPGTFKVQVVSLDGNKTDECQPCKPGYYSAKQNVQVCAACPLGYFANQFVSLDGKVRHDRCQSCPRGTFGSRTNAKNASDGCDDCTSGRFSELEGRTKASDCKGCPKGTWSATTGVTKESACIKCGTGKYGQDKIGANTKTWCTSCDRGRFQGTVGMSNSSSCVGCPSGFVQNKTGEAFCLPCTPGGFNSKEGQAECTKCAVGKASTTVANTMGCVSCTEGSSQPLQGMTACLHCIPGRSQSKQEQTKCIECSINTFAKVSQQHVCETCAVGQYTRTKGSASCVSCGAGSFGIGCVKCPKGWYRSADDKDLSRCKQCAAGETTGGMGAASCSNCDLGMFGNTTGTTRECVDCPIGKYQDERKQLECKTCANDKLPNAAKTSCESTTWTTAGDCDEAQYLNDSSIDQYQHTCAPCPRGASCKGAVAWRNVTAKYGWWRMHVAENPNRPPECLSTYDKTIGPPPCAFVACIHPHACHGASNPGRYKNDKLQDAALENRNETCDWDGGYKKNTCGVDSNQTCRLCGKTNEQQCVLISFVL